MDLIASLAPAVVTGSVALLTIYLTNRGNNERLNMQLLHEKTRQQTELIQARGEELYQLVYTWQNNFSTQYLAMASVMRGEISYNEGLDIQKDEIADTDFGRIPMLIFVYFPKIQQKYDQVISLRSIVNERLSAHKAAYKLGEIDGTAFINPFNKDSLNLDKALVELMAAIAIEIRNSA